MERLFVKKEGDSFSRCCFFSRPQQGVFVIANEVKQSSNF